MDLVASLKDAFEPVTDQVLGVFLCGSHARGEATPRSDVDVCVVAGPGRGVDDVLRRVWRRVRPPAGMELDVRVFEELPMYLKAALLEDDALVVSRNPLDLYEYLLPFRRMWQDQVHRQRLTREEARALLES